MRSASWVRVRVSAPPGNGGFVCSSTSLRGRRRCRVLPFRPHIWAGETRAGAEFSPSRPHIWAGDSPGTIASLVHSSTSGPEGVRPGLELQTHSGPRRDPPGKEDVRVRAWAGGLHRGEERRGQRPRAESQEDCSGHLLPMKSSRLARTAVPREPDGFPQPQTGGEGGAGAEPSE